MGRVRVGYDFSHVGVGDGVKVCTVAVNKFDTRVAVAYTS
jgi:hypothetical protein